jgi:hypothetical protein
VERKNGARVLELACAGVLLNRGSRTIIESNRMRELTEPRFQPKWEKHFPGPGLGRGLTRLARVGRRPHYSLGLFSDCVQAVNSKIFPFLFLLKYTRPSEENPSQAFGRARGVGRAACEWVVGR